eukprot:scaffold1245_cov122-Isochrysis_galbana.AAC.1
MGGGGPMGPMGGGRHIGPLGGSGSGPMGPMGGVPLQPRLRGSRKLLFPHLNTRDTSTGLTHKR